MFPQRSHLLFMAATGLMSMAGGSQAQTAARPAAVEALEARGLTILGEFKGGDEVRAFAGVAGDRPIAVYVMRDGTAIVGTRLDTNAEPIDSATLGKLVAKPISDKAWAQLESSTWVLDGRADAPRVVYTFSDANCPYCHRFWEATRPWVDAGKVQLRHIMVGIIKEDSPAKAAAILGASDPSAALVENEQKFDQGGIRPASRVPGDVRKVLDDNKALMLAMGFQGTPGIVVRDSDGLVRKYNGMPQQAMLGEVLGPR